MGLLIQDEAVVAKVNRLANASGQTADQVIADAVERLVSGQAPQPAPGRLHGEDLRRLIKKLQAEIAAMPTSDPNFTEDDLYDENGLPA